MKKLSGETASRWPHRVGCLLACIIFPLIWVGNLVTTTDAGMAVPDWPGTYGYNLFLYPYREWFFGPWDLFVEHGHRLLASLAGLVSIVLVVVTYRSESRRWVRRLAAFILGLVIFQGFLGGVRVVFDERLVAKIHGCIGPFYFATAVLFCVVTSRWWLSVSDRKSKIGTSMPAFAKFAVLMLVASYLQLVFGAFIRHIDDTAAPSQFVWLIAMHVVTACLIVVGTLVQFVRSRQLFWANTGVRTSISVLSVLVLAQFSLGVGTWVVKFGWPGFLDHYYWAASFIVPEKSFFQVNTITAHAALGSLILAFYTVHASRSLRVGFALVNRNIDGTEIEVDDMGNGDSDTVIDKETKKGDLIGHPV